MKISVFRADITPPVGHPICAGWYPAAVGTDDCLFANGVIIFPDGELPVVLCALDWAELSNGEFDLWKTRLAKAAGTAPDRVAIHCIHCHGAPWPDRAAQSILDDHGSPDIIMWRNWADEVLDDVCAALAANVGRAIEVTEIRAGKAEAWEVASNRRILGHDGKVRATRWIECFDPLIQAEPLGLIDPFLKTVSFHGAAGKIVALHFYAVHATCRHDLKMSREFAGIARDRLAEKEGVPHIYFTECAGNITVGKYNRQDPGMREVFAARILEAMEKAGNGARPVPHGSFLWKTCGVVLPPNPDNQPPSLLDILDAPEAEARTKSRAAIILAYRQRCEEGRRISITAMHLGPEICILSLPGESFIEYQLFAQRLKPDSMVLVPAYGDCGPGYVPPDRCHAEGGYEPVDAFCGVGSEAILRKAIEDVLDVRSTFPTASQPL